MSMNDTSIDVSSDTSMTMNTTWTATEPPEVGLSSRDLIILWFVLFTGMIGSLANGSVLIALVADKKLRKYSSTFLVKYQIVLDFVACVLLVVSYAVKVEQDGRADTTRRWGNVVCMLFIGDGLVSVAMYAAAANLAMIALERYSKIVHSVKHRIHFKTWMLYLAVAFTILQSVLVNIPMIWTSVIDDGGHCNDFSLWSNPADVEAYSIFLTVWLYAALLGVLIYCYGRIIKQLNRKTPKVAPAEVKPANSGHEEGSMNRSQVNVIKTMIIISVTYAVTSFLNYIGYIAWAFDNNSALDGIPQYYVNIALYFLNAWLDPFIYVLSHKDVRTQFLRYVSCNRLKVEDLQTELTRSA